MTSIQPSFTFESQGPRSERDYFNMYTSDTFKTASDLSHVNSGETEQIEKLEANIAEYISGMNKSLITANIDTISSQKNKSRISISV